MLPVKAWVVAKLKGYEPLVSVLGGIGHIQFMYPATFNILPVVTYQELNQAPPFRAYFDNEAQAWESTIQLDIWTGENVSTTAIAQAISDLFVTGFKFALEYNSDVPEPNPKIQHRVMRISKLLVADDLG